MIPWVVVVPKVFSAQGASERAGTEASAHFFAKITPRRQTVKGGFFFIPTAPCNTIQNPATGFFKT